MMHFDDFERPIDIRILELRKKGCYELADEWFRLSRVVHRWDIVNQGLGLFGGIGRGIVSRKVAARESTRQEIWRELLQRFFSVLLDVCATARPKSSDVQLEAEMVKILVNCDQSGTARNGCLPEILWKTASDQYGLDGIAHLSLRRKFHLRALLDEVEASNDRGAVRPSGTPLLGLYSIYKESLSAGYTMFAYRLYELRPHLDQMTKGAITSKDVPTVLAALRLIGACLGTK
jgi:hypothetical protein